jgi:hypothetical protein
MQHVPGAGVAGEEVFLAGARDVEIPIVTARRQRIVAGVVLILEVAFAPRRR